jgi:hypothetical protein
MTYWPGAPGYPYMFDNGFLSQSLGTIRRLIHTLLGQQIILQELHLIHLERIHILLGLLPYPSGTGSEFHLK